MQSRNRQLVLLGWGIAVLLLLHLACSSSTEPDPVEGKDPGPVTLVVARADGATLQSPSFGGALLRVGGVAADSAATIAANAGLLLCQACRDTLDAELQLLLIDDDASSADSVLGVVYLEDRRALPSARLELLGLCSGSSDSLDRADYVLDVIQQE